MLGYCLPRTYMWFVANEQIKEIISEGNNCHAKSNNPEEVPWGKSSLDKRRLGLSEETRSVRNYYRGEDSGKGMVNAAAWDAGGFSKDRKKAGVVEA